MKEDNASQTYVYKKLVEYLVEKVVKEREKMEKLSDINKVLTNNEIALVVNTCKELSTMGLGIDKDSCLYIYNVVILHTHRIRFPGNLMRTCLLNPFLTWMKLPRMPTITERR